MKTIERRTAHAQREPVKRAWYEHAGAQVMAIDLGVTIGAIATRVLHDWTVVAAAGVIGILLASFGVFGIATWYSLRIEQARAERARETLRRANTGAAPQSRDDVPPEHKRSR